MLHLLDDQIGSDAPVEAVAAVVRDAPQRCRKLRLAEPLSNLWGPTLGEERRFGGRVQAQIRLCASEHARLALADFESVGQPNGRLDQSLPFERALRLVRAPQSGNGARHACCEVPRH